MKTYIRTSSPALVVCVDPDARPVLDKYSDGLKGSVTIKANGMLDTEFNLTNTLNATTMATARRICKERNLRLRNPKVVAVRH